MTTNRFAWMKELVILAADIPDDERRAFLDEACGSDTGLRRKIESVLAYESCRPGILEKIDDTPLAGSDIPAEVSLRERDGADQLCLHLGLRSQVAYRTAPCARADRTSHRPIMSVELMSSFSYQWAVGSTISEKKIGTHIVSPSSVENSSISSASLSTKSW